MKSERVQSFSFIHSEIKKSCQDTEKKIIPAEEVDDLSIIQIAVDVDNCMFAEWEKLHQSEKGKSFQDLYAWFIEERQDILKLLVKMIQEGKFNLAIICLFTTRQNYTDDTANGFQSCTTVPLLITAYLESQCPKVKFLIDRLMVADVQATPSNNGAGEIKKAGEIKEAGDTFNLILKQRYGKKKPQDKLLALHNSADDVGKHIVSSADPYKRCLFYLFMHRPFHAYPKAKKIHSVFIDDSQSVLNSIYDFAFLRSNDFLPPGTMDFIEYSAKGIGEIRHQRGAGIVDMHYIWTARFLYLFAIAWHQCRIDRSAYDSYEKIAALHSSFVEKDQYRSDLNSSFVYDLDELKQFLDPIFNDIIPQLPSALVAHNYISLSQLSENLDFPLLSILGIPTAPSFSITDTEKSSTSREKTETLPQVIAAIEKNESKLEVISLVKDEANIFVFSNIDVAESFCKENNLLDKEIILNPDNKKYFIFLSIDEKLKLIKNGELKEPDPTLKTQTNFVLTVFATIEELRVFLEKYDLERKPQADYSDTPYNTHRKKHPILSFTLLPDKELSKKNLYKIHLNLSELLHLQSQLSVLNSVPTLQPPKNKG